MNKYISALLVAALPVVLFSSCSSDDEPEAPEEKDPHTYVDLGLSVLWADCNIGAEKNTDFGDFYAWGETETKEEYTFGSYKFADQSENKCLDIGEICGTEYDVAHVLWGFDWRMPSSEEVQELVNECTWELISIGKVVGYHVIGPNGKSIFLPCAGYKYRTDHLYSGECGIYWCGTPQEYKDNSKAYCLYMDFKASSNSQYRYVGQSVRAVKPRAAN